MASTTTRFASSTRIVGRRNFATTTARSCERSNAYSSKFFKPSASLAKRTSFSVARMVVLSATSSTLSSTNHARVEISLVPLAPPTPLPDVDDGDRHRNVFASDSTSCHGVCDQNFPDDDDELNASSQLSPGRPNPPFAIARALARRLVDGRSVSNRRRRRPLQSSPRWSPTTAFARMTADMTNRRRDATRPRRSRSLSFALVRSRAAQCAIDRTRVAPGTWRVADEDSSNLIGSRAISNRIDIETSRHNDGRICRTLCTHTHSAHTHISSRPPSVESSRNVASTDGIHPID